MSKKLTTYEFICKSTLKHGDRYGYSLVNYIDAITKVKIICHEHGVFEQIPHSHLNNHGCPKCGIIVAHDKLKGLRTKPKTIKDFIENANLVHGFKYDYSIVDYKHSKIKVNIICKEHGVFEQEPNSHLRRGCPKCSGHYKTINEFILEAKLIHGDKFDYSLVKYISSTDKIKILCDKHGVFEQRPNSHLNGDGCPICKESKGERNIRLYLNENNIIFISQKKFKNCKYIKELPFDFYLPEMNICIEYDGIQHFKPINIWGGNERFIEQQIKDEIKTKFCNDNNIILIRISYKENNIKSLLNDNLTKLHIFNNKVK